MYSLSHLTCAFSRFTISQYSYVLLLLFSYSKNILSVSDKLDNRDHFTNPCRNKETSIYICTSQRTRLYLMLAFVVMYIECYPTPIKHFLHFFSLINNDKITPLNVNILLALM